MFGKFLLSPRESIALNLAIFRVGREIRILSTLLISITEQCIERTLSAVAFSMERNISSVKRFPFLNISSSKHLEYSTMSTRAFHEFPIGA